MDYIGIAKALKEAMHDYTRRDREKFGNPDIKETALLKFREKLEVCRDLFHGYDYSNFLTESDLERAQVIKGGAKLYNVAGQAGTASIVHERGYASA